MNVFRFIVNFKANPALDTEQLHRAVRAHFGEAGINLLSFHCDTDFCECVTEVREFPNGFPYRVKVFAGLDQAFEECACPIACIPPEEMRFEER